MPQAGLRQSGSVWSRGVHGKKTKFFVGGQEVGGSLRLRDRERVGRAGEALE